MMDTEQFSMMKPTAYFINAARGKLVNEQALIQVLKNNSIMGAAIDVFEFEPEVTSELFEMENVVLTPHIGTSTYESRIGIIFEALGGISNYLKNAELPATIVNRDFYLSK